MGSQPSQTKKPVKMLSLCFAFLLFGIAAAQQTISNCTIETDSPIYPVVLDVLSTDPAEDCQLVDEQLCSETCNSQSQAFDGSFSLTDSYPGDAGRRSYGDVWCDNINKDLADLNFDADWWISGFSVVQGQRCLFPILPTWT